MNQSNSNKSTFKEICSSGSPLIIVGAIFLISTFFTDDSGAMVAIGCVFIAIGAAQRNKASKSDDKD